MINIIVSKDKAKHQSEDFLYNIQKTIALAFPSYSINCEFGEIEQNHSIETDNKFAQMDISDFIETNSELFFK